MKKLMSLLFLGVLLLVIGCEKDFIFDDPLDPETKVALRVDVDPVAIDQAIEEGIAWMLTQQDPTDGFFSNSESDGVARTALAITKLCDRAVEDGFTPQNHPDYAIPISDGLAFILANATPHGEGGIILNAGPAPNHDVYNTGIAMMALAAYRCPDCTLDVGVAGVDTYKKLLDKNVEFFEDIQNPDGGWRYWDNITPSDNSNTGFAALGLLAAQEFGCDVSDASKMNLSGYIDFIQNSNGGSGYTHPTEWVNTMKTGNLLFEMALVGDTPDASARAQNAVTYLVNNWNAPSGTDYSTPGWKPDNWLAMYCMMKGAVSIGLDDFGGIDWFNEFASAIISQQRPGGYWDPGPWVDEYLATVFNLLTLEKIAPEAFIKVGFDIKPTSCPNPVNLKSRGVVPMAILGADDFDVNEINLSTVNIEGINPVNSSFDDVATPYEAGPEGLDDKMDCTTEGADGFMDLVIHFETQDLVPLLTDYVRDDVVVLTIQGELNDGRVFRGEDIMVIVSKK